MNLQRCVSERYKIQVISGCVFAPIWFSDGMALVLFFSGAILISEGVRMYLLVLSLYL